MSRGGTPTPLSLRLAALVVMGASEAELAGWTDGWMEELQLEREEALQAGEWRTPGFMDDFVRQSRVDAPYLAGDWSSLSRDFGLSPRLARRALTFTLIMWAVKFSTRPC